jgi:hypothetical protein
MPETLRSILESDAAFIGFSLAALVATLVVAIGLFLEYERHELFGASKKQIGALMVAGGVVLEAGFGLGTFLSAIVRESRSELQIATLTVRANQLEKDAETARGQIASANERAATAQRKAVQDEIALLQLQDKMAWRHIDAEEESMAFGDDAGSALAGHTIIVSANPFDAEAKNFVEDIDACLKMAHAKVKRVFSLKKGKLAPGLNCLATKGRASERDVLLIAHLFSAMAPPVHCAVMYRLPTDLGPAEINVGAKPEL